MSLHEFLGEERLLEWFYSKNSSNTGTRVGYRRVSGKIGLTNKENGVRGAWVEKRVALFKNMLEFGHRIIPLSEATDATKDDGFETFDTYQECDVLMLEFGGTNLQFYQKYWDKTVEMIKSHKGRVIFLNDDPDLPFLWELLPDEDWSRWTIAANATECNEVATILKCPIGTTTVDLPMASGMEFATSIQEISKRLFILADQTEEPNTLKSLLPHVIYRLQVKSLSGKTMMHWRF